MILAMVVLGNMSLILLPTDDPAWILFNGQGAGKTSPMHFLTIFGNLNTKRLNI
jgi:hypothetical protein